MKKIAILLLSAFLLSVSTTTFAASKLEKRHAYTLKNLNLDKKTETAFSPILMQYLKDKKEAGKKYDDLKDKYKAAEKAGTLTDNQATQLLEAKMECDAAELEVKKRYYPEFLKVLRPKKVYYAFDLSNDKMSKIEGRDKDKD